MLIRRIIVIALIGAGAFACIAAESQSSIPAKFDKTFVGKIGDKYAIHLEVTRSDNTLVGSYYYDNVGIGIDVMGTIDPSGKFKMTESNPDGTETGAFTGSITVSGSGDSQVMKLTGTWLKKGGTTPLTFDLTEQRIDLGPGAKMGSKTINRDVKKPKYSIEVEYPQVVGKVNAGQDAFNKLVESIVTKRIAEFKNGVGDPQDHDSQGSSFDVGYETQFASPNLISITLSIGEYDTGAAHPNSFSLTINYNVAEKREIKLSELFKPGSKYLTAISSYCLAQLKKKLGDDETDMLKTGTEPKAENYKNWNITDSGVLIQFDPYAVAPYVAGPQSVLVPYSKLAAILDPTGPAASLMK